MTITRLTRIDVVLLFAVVCLAQVVDHHGNNNDGNDHDNDDCRDDGYQNDREIVAFICEIKKGGGGGGKERGRREGRRGDRRKGKEGKKEERRRNEGTHSKHLVKYAVYIDRKLSGMQTLPYSI